MEKKRILTIDIGASKIRIQTIDRDGEFGFEKIINLIGLDLDNNNFSELLINNIKPIIDTEENVISICIAAPGLVDSNNKIIEKLPNIKKIKDLDVGKLLEDVFSLPIFLLNDADAGALGEWPLGAGKGFENIIYLTLGTGVGSGIITDNKLQHGSELGHRLPIFDTEQRLCVCGRTNCAESFLGTTGLGKIYKKIFGIEDKNLGNAELYSLSLKMRAGVEANDQKWLEVQSEYTKYLSLFLETIISTYQPQAIIIGGGIAYNNETLLEKTKNRLGSEAKDVKILLSKFENAVNIGAARYTFDLLALEK